MSDLASLYIRVDSSGVVTASRDLDKLTGASKQAESAQKGLETQSRKTEKATAALTKSFAAMAVTMAATWAAANAWSLAKLGAELEETRGILNNLSKQYKTTADDIVSAMARASQGLIANSDLMRTALGGLAKGLNPEQLIKLSGAAAILGDTIGKSATVALKELTEALESGRTRGLYVYGKSALDLGDAFGKLEGKMSAAERAQAMYLLVMIHATKLQKQQTDAVSDAADKFESMEAKYRNYADTFSVVIMKMTVRLGDYLVAVGKAAQKTAQFFGLTDLPSGATRDFGEPKDDLAEYKKQLADLKALLAKKPGEASADKSIAAAQRLREEWEKTKKSLETDIRLEGLSGARLEFEQTLIKYEELEKQVKSLPPSLQKSAQAFIDLWKAKKDAATTDELIGGYGRDAIKEMEEERKEVDRLTDAYQGLMDSLDHFEANKDKYQKALGVLAGNFEKGNITKEQYDSGMEAVGIEKDLMDANVYADFYAEIQGYEDEYRRKKFEAIEAEQKLRAKYYKDDVAAAKWAADEKAKLEYDLFKEKTDYLSQGFGDLSTAFDGISKMYGEGSEEAKKWQQASEAMLIAQKAVAVVQAVAAIATQGLGDPYTAFARIAAMAAAMGALLATIGESVGGGTAAASAPKTYNYGGDAGPLGAETGTASESLANSLESVEGSLDNIFNVEDVKLQKIYNELRSLNQNITGLVSSIFRTGTGDYSSFGMETGTTESWATSLYNKNFQNPSGLVLSNVLGENYNTLRVAMLDFGGLLVDKAVGWVAGKVFGGETEVSLQKGGIEFGNVLVSSVMDGMSVSARQFALYKIEEDGGWFHSDSTSWETRYAALNDDVVNMLTKVFDNLGGSLVELAKGLGTDVQAVYDYVFKSTQLDLKDMNADEMSKALTTYFSDMADQAASDLFGTIIKQYQQVNEALFETAVRLVTDKETVMNVLSATGHGMEQITTSVTKTRQAISDEWTKWEADRLKWSSSFIGKITTAFGGSYGVAEPEKYYTQTYNEITSNAQALIELSESLIELAGGLDKLTESAESYYTAFYSEAQQIAMLKGQLSGAFAELERAFPATRSGFRGVVEGLDLTTQAGKEAYVAMLNMAESADKYYSYIEELADKRAEMEIDLLKLQGDAVGALAKERAGELEEMDESLRVFQTLIYAQQDFNDLLEKSTSLLEQWHSMESDLLELQGDKVGALAVKREAELDALDESLRPLQELLYAQEDLNNARAKEITAVGNLITAQGQVVSELQGDVDKLKSARESMKMEGMKFAAEQVVSARLAFNAVLGQARMGDLSGIGTVDNAMSKLVENANSPNAFKTKQEYEENYYRTYNDIAELEKLAGTQLSTEEQTLNTLKDQLKVLNQIAGNTDNADLSVQDAQNAVDLAHADVIAKQAALEQARAQYEATRQAFVTMEEVVNSINGNNNQLTMSIAEMTTALLEAKQAVVDATAGWATYQANQAAADAAAEQARLEALSAKHEAEAQAEADAQARIEATNKALYSMSTSREQEYGLVIGKPALLSYDELMSKLADGGTYTQADQIKWATNFNDVWITYGTYFLDEMGKLLRTTSTTHADVSGEVDNYLRGQGISKYASGGSFPGGWRVVGEEGPELEYTGPSQITSNASSKALLDNSEVVKELKSLREDIKAYGYAIAKNTGKSAKVSDRWDIDGLPAERTIT